MFADAPGIHLFALLPACAQVQPGNGFQRDQAILADPGQAIDLAAAGHDKCVIGVIEQDGRQA
ncbi:hypothetical protein D3C81_2300040 [compost metagenome]